MPPSTGHMSDIITSSRRMAEQLWNDEVCRQYLLQNVGGRTVHTVLFYSGAGSLRVGLGHFVDALNEVGNLGFSMKFVADIEKMPCCQKFLHLAFDEGAMIKDAKHCTSKADVHDERNGDFIPCPVGHFSIGGPICGAMSSLNINKKRNASCIDTRTAGTGETFGYMFDHARVHEIPTVMVENSPNFDKAVAPDDVEDASPLLSATHQFSEIGYFGASRQVKALYQQRLLVHCMLVLLLMFEYTLFQPSPRASSDDPLAPVCFTSPCCQ